jgi:Flp pilus assembly protein CpaB
VRTRSFVMIGFAVLFGLLAVFLAQIWLNNQADERLKSIDAQRKAAPPARSIVVAGKPLRFGDELSSAALREMPWPDNALPAGAFGKIADLTSSKRVVLIPIDTNEAVLAVDQLADQRADKPSVVKAVTIEVDPTEGQKVALAATVGTLSLLLRKAGEATGRDTRRVTTRDPPLASCGRPRASASNTPCRWRRATRIPPLSRISSRRATRTRARQAEWMGLLGFGDNESRGGRSE